MHLTSLLVKITHPTPTTYWIYKSQGKVSEMLSLPSQRPLNEGQVLLQGMVAALTMMGLEKELQGHTQPLRV